MNRSFIQSISTLFIFLALCMQGTLVKASSHKATHSPYLSITPTAPHLAASSYILLDADSNKVVAEKNSKKRLPPASLTKMMTMYVISSALKQGQIKLDDEVRISKKAWKTGGSKMFIRAGQMVKVQDLIQGIIVDSGNDACVAMAQYMAGNEHNFAKLMNLYAKKLGMVDSHFTDSTGLPDPNLYSTAHDLAILGRALVKDFPEYYHWYKQKWFTFNGIKQPNRNRLLWRLPSVDGIKTGHTDKAGFCLVASAMDNDTRFVTAVLGAPTDEARAQDSQRLINYGFRFFETHKLYSKGEKLNQLKVWKGQAPLVDIQVNNDVYVTLPKGDYETLDIQLKTPAQVEAPIQAGTRLGEVLIQSKHNQEKITIPVYAATTIEQGGFFKRLSDGLKMKIGAWFS